MVAVQLSLSTRSTVGVISRGRAQTNAPNPSRPAPAALAPRPLVFRSRKVSVAASGKDELKAKAGELKDALGAKAGNLASSAGDLAAKLGDALPKSREDLAKIDLGISKLVVYNFWIQAVLTVMAWAVLGVSLHQHMGKGLNIVSPPIFANMAGVLLAAFSAFTSFSYMNKVKEGGEAVLDGFDKMQTFFDHLKINFAGAVCAILGLQAEVGQIFSSAMFGGAAEAAKAASSEAAFAQAAANTILAHLVSLMFLSFMIRKISMALQRQVEWSMEMRETVAKLSVI